MLALICTTASCISLSPFTFAALPALLALPLVPLVQRLALLVLVRPAAVVLAENSRGRGRISMH